jgi:hypothetical protein
VAHDVFVSYSSQNKTVADAICATLEGREIRCWIAPRDIAPGADWAGSIIEAIETSRAMVLVFSRHTNQSQQVLREVERAVNASLAIVPFRIEDVPFSKSFAYFLSSTHWMDAMTPPLRARIEELSDTVGRLVGGPDVLGARELDAELSSMSRRDPEGFGLVRGVMRGMQTGDWCTVRKRAEEGTTSKRASCAGGRTGSNQALRRPVVVGTVGCPKIRVKRGTGSSSSRREARSLGRDMERSRARQ